MKRMVVNLLQYLFFLGLGLFFVWLSIRKINGEQWLAIQQSLRQARVWLIVPVIAMLLLSHYSRALRWRILMEPLGYQPSRFNVFAAVMIGYLVNAAVPRLGEVVKCTLLARTSGVGADKLVGTIVMERAVDVVCLLVVFLAALLFQGHIIGGFVTSLFGNLFKDAGGAVSYSKAILYGAGFILFLLLFAFLLRRFAHLNAVAKLKSIVNGVVRGLQSIRFIKHKGWFVFHSVFIWVLYFASTTLGIYALKETAPLGMGGGITTLAVGSVGMILTPGGIGAYPLLVSQLIELYGIDKNTIGNALGWLLWAVQTVIVVVGGLVLAVLFSYFNKKRKPIEPAYIAST